MNRTLKLAECGLVVLLLLYCTGAVLPLFMPASDGLADPTSGNGFAFVLQGVFVVAVLSLLLMYWRLVLEGCFEAKWILLLTLMAMASVAWSDSPVLTVRRSLLLAITTLFGVYFGRRFSRQDQLRIVIVTLGIAAILSIAVAALVPDLGVSHGLHEGDWKGVFSQKNALGRVMVLNVLCLLLLRPSSWRESMYKWAGVSLALALIFLSGSRTALLVLMLLVAALPILAIIRWRATDTVAVLSFAATAILVIGVALADRSDTLLAVLGRDGTLTGRTMIWRAVLGEISLRPLLGYGFAGFWRGLEGESSTVVQAVHWAVMQAHNGYLDLVLDLGWTGMAIFSGSFLFVSLHSLRLVRSSGNYERLWPAAFLIFTFLYNLTEGGILKTTNIFWIVYTACCVGNSSAQESVTPTEGCHVR